MAAEPSELSTLARSKLHLSVGGRERCSLHRWVLLKNSIVRALPLTTTSLSQSEPTLSHCTHHYHHQEHADVDVEDEEVGPEETDSFIFPNAEKFVDNSNVDRSAEEDWLDSVLENLGDDDDSDTVSLQTDDDDDHLLSPLLSPMSSSDDLTSDYYSPSNYPVPYPPYHPPLVRTYDVTFDDSFFDSTSHDHPFPYYDEDDVSDLPVPDAIEDTSDDESDTPLTPSIGQSSDSSVLRLVDPAAIPLPVERGSYGQNGPRVFIHTSESCFYPHSEDFHLSYSFRPHFRPQEC
ncbi:hypothetical protein VNI00_003406 [Paramarasmius palmivorus]|uniref:Uncharacterized protein n=1 Tax=Paramarasmius palmivorus TaxID=297713 RepID=A0AAW0DQC4_9AGAR